MANDNYVLSAVGEEEAGAVHGCNTPKFKLTAYGVHILRKDSVDIKPDRSA